MRKVTYAGHEVPVDDEGYLVEPASWSEEMAPEIADDAGVGPLTEEHWRVVKFMRSSYEHSGTAPTVRGLARTSGIPIKELYALFPRGPAKTAARIAGIPKPRGCV